MPFNDGIQRKFSFSLTDFHEFESCAFRFFVKHDLGKKYELEEGNFNVALGCLLDQAVKLFHSSRAYGQPPEYVKNLVKASCSKMIDKIESTSGPSFYSSIKEFLNEDLCKKASEIFENYYKERGCKINRSIAQVGFCEWVIDEKFKLWGGPDALEEGDDGIPEIVDYKSRENVEKGKDNMDMDLMPKIYTLLCSKKLKRMGHKKARFRVRFWQDPKEERFYEEFDLEDVQKYEILFKNMIEKILNTTQITLCEKGFCKACFSPEKDLFITELAKLGLVVLSSDTRSKTLNVEDAFFAP